MPREDQVRALLTSAEDHTRAGRYQRAVNTYRRVLRLAPHGDFACEIAHARLGDLHLGLNQADSAVLHLQRARALAADEPEYALMLGIALLAADRATEAASILYDALGSAHHAPRVLATLAHVADAMGDRAAAGQLARHAAQRGGDDPEFRALARTFADA